MSLRPTTLKEIAERSDSLGDFGRHLRDWLHELRRASSRTQAAATITDEPPRLRDKFLQGGVADAWLAAYAEHLAGKIGVVARGRGGSAHRKFHAIGGLCGEEAIFENDRASLCGVRSEQSRRSLRLFMAQAPAKSRRLEWVRHLTPLLVNALL